MQCAVCGQEYGIAHACACVPAMVTPDNLAPPPGLRFAPVYYPAPWNLLGPRFIGTLVSSLACMFFQVGLAHALAKIIFDAKGSLTGLMRTYLLGQMYQWLVIVPFFGGTLVGIGGIAVLILVVEEVDGIERMKTFGLAAVIGVNFWILILFGRPLLFAR